MSLEKNLSRDLHSILDSYLDLIGCDGGSIYTVEKDDSGSFVLVFKAMVTRSLGIFVVPEHLKSTVFEIDENSMIGRTGLHRRVFKENRLGDQTENSLSAPLLTPRGELVGVVKLVNKIAMDSESNPDFDARDERLCAIVSSQAALAIENSTLLIEQEKILDGFVNACVTAIEARDPVTAGHSERVCDLTLNLAETVNRTHQGTLAKLRFNEIEMREMRYAAMLHDIGKISVREDILKKEKKLYPWELTQIEMRFKLMRISLKNQYAGEKNEFELAKKLRELDQALKLIRSANEPTVLPTEVSQTILDLTRLQVQVEGEVCCALHAEESTRLLISRGSLSAEERISIEKHVSFTYEILKMVPWGRGLENVPLIAHRHHEKLDGSGYPLGVPGDEIPAQSRMLTICDIYDALTANDRPYKPAVPVQQALSILESEVLTGKLDANLFQLFLESKAYELPFIQTRKTVKKVA